MILDNTGFKKLQDLILERTGLTFGRRQNDLQAMEALAQSPVPGSDPAEALYRRLQTARFDSDLWEDLVEAITVGETYFFRDASQFDALRNELLPRLIARRRTARRLRIWSAGCASGEEPYSLAMLLHGLIPDVDNWNISILATDINKQFLRKAQEGSYSEWSFRQTDPAIREKYFKRRGNQFKLRSRIRKMVTFSYLNLVADTYPLLQTNTTALDLILCRNVAIYLKTAHLRQIAAKFYQCLVPEGVLIVGAAETDGDVYRRFATRHIKGAFVYEKTSKRPPCPAPPAASLAAGPAGGGAGIEGSKPVWTEQLPAKPAAEVSPQALYEAGREYLENRRYREALASFQAHLRLAPDAARTRYQIARLQANAGQLDEAGRQLEKAVNLDPLAAEFHYMLGLVEHARGEQQKAVRLFQKTLYLEPDFLLAHFSLSAVFHQSERPREAARHCKLAIRLATRLPPQAEIPHSDGMTALQLMRILRAMNLPG